MIVVGREGRDPRLSDVMLIVAHSRQFGRRDYVEGSVLQQLNPDKC